jgi:putative flavoprotein involved in K+ transport
MSEQTSSIVDTNTLVIGAGQAGLVTSYHLRTQGVDHLVVESESQPAHQWLDCLWDSFTLVTPNWTVRLPGAEYDGDDPEGFMTRLEVADRLHAYARRYDMPIRFKTRATAVTPMADGRFEVRTSTGTVRARNVVMATGLFQAPRIPACAAGFAPGIEQLHSSQYKNPQRLKDGAVLVVGSSQSGAQIADEIHRSGRRVFLCVGKSGRAPRRYRGKDSSQWLELLGMADMSVDQLQSPKMKYAANPHIIGRADGRNLNLHRFHRDGMTLLGLLSDVRDNRLHLAGDLHENLAVADNFEAAFLKRIDQYIADHGLDCPAEDVLQLRDGYEAELITELDVAAAGIATVIWAAGYSFDFGLVKCPVFDEDGYPLQKRGITEQPGLYFVGLPWLYKARSGLLSGVGDDAAHVVSDIVARA